MYRHYLPALAASLAVGCLLSAAPPTVAQQPPAQELKAFLDRVVVIALRESPEYATSLAVPPEQAGGKYADRLSDLSREGLERRAKLARELRQELARLDRSKLSPNDAVTYDVVMTELENSVAGDRFGFGTYGFQAPTPYIVSQIDGAYVNIPDFLDSQHQVKSAQDAEDYLARVRRYATMLDQESARISQDASKGIVPPDFVIDGALKQLRTIAELPAANTVLVQSLARKAEAAGLPAGQQKDLVARATAAVRDEVLPAYRRQIAALEALRGKATHDAGVWRLPQGGEYYRAALRKWNTTDLSPDEIHTMGLKLIEQLHKEMDAILDAQKLTEGSVGARLQQLAKDPAQVYPNTADGRASLIQTLNEQIAELQPLLPRYFGTLAQAKLDIRRVPEYIESGAPGGYYQAPALDGSRPGAYYINLRDTSEWPKFSLPTLTYHEGNPGHHWQIAIAQESTGLHLIRSAILGFSGYQEGWGLYAEQLADEMGMYRKDPLGRLGYLQSMAFRAARLVVDTGLHHKKWSREKAIDYMVEVTGDQRSSITTEVERYAVWPGQATAYMVGREVLNRLRTDARSKLGERFDIRGFHDTVLTNGPMPLSVLEQVVRSWVSQQQAAGR